MPQIFNLGPGCNFENLQKGYPFLDIISYILITKLRHVSLQQKLEHLHGKFQLKKYRGYRIIFVEKKDGKSVLILYLL